MVVMVLVLVRATMGLENLITMYHLEVMNKVILTCSCLMGYSYLMEGFTAWYSMNQYIHHIFLQYIAGTYWWAGWTTITCNILIPQLLWVRRFRRSYFGMIFVAIAVTVGMWFERFVIIVSSLHQDYLPSAWHVYQADPGGFRHPARNLRSVLHPGAAFCPSAAGDCHDRDEGGPSRKPAPAQGRSP